MPLRVDWSRNKSQGEIVITDHKTEIIVTQYYVGDDHALEDMVAPVRFQYSITGSVVFGGDVPEDRDSVRKVRTGNSLIISYLEESESAPVRLEAEYVPRTARLGPSTLLVEYGVLVNLSFLFERKREAWCEVVRIRPCE